MALLYLGLDPSRFQTEKKITHYPMLKTEKKEIVLPTLQGKVRLLFTSRTAVQYWNFPFFDEVIAIGPATGAALLERGVEPLTAKEATQEGVIELLKRLSWEGVFLLYPHAEKSRTLIREFLSQKALAHWAFPFYRTVFQANRPYPDFSEYDEIVFTSPSTVDAFLHFFHEFPSHCKLTPIGPVTKSHLQTALQK